MKVWLVLGTSTNDPDQRTYILGAHSSREAADKQSAAGNPAYTARIIEIIIDGSQPPVLINNAAAGADPCVADRLGDQS